MIKLIEARKLCDSAPLRLTFLWLRFNSFVGVFMNTIVGVSLIEQAKSLVEKMPVEQRREFLAWMALDAKKVKHDLDEAKSDRQAWLTALLQAFNALHGIGDTSPYRPGLLKPPTGFPSSWAACDHFMQQAGLDKLKVVERRAVYGLLARLVVSAAGKMCDSTGSPMSLNTCCTYSVNLPGIFNSAFPGYARSGLVLTLAQRMIQGERGDGKLQRSTK